MHRKEGQTEREPIKPLNEQEKKLERKEEGKEWKENKKKERKYVARCPILNERSVSPTMDRIENQVERIAPISERYSIQLSEIPEKVSKSSRVHTQNHTHTHTHTHNHNNTDTNHLKPE